jgi:type II secretory pathway component PulK
MDRRGSLLVITLWMISLLSVLAIAIARHLSTEVRLTKYAVAKTQARALARGGIQAAVQVLANDLRQPEELAQAYDWFGDSWAAAPGSGTGEWSLVVTGSGGDEEIGRATFQIVDEQGKVSLNAAPREQLSMLVGDDALAQVIVDARDEPDPAEDQPDGAPPYLAKNGPFVAMEELWDLPGMHAGAYAALRRAASAFTAAEEPINLNTATREALLAAGVDDGAIQIVFQYRDGPDGPDQHANDGIFTEPGVAIIETLKDREGVDLTGTPAGNLLISNAFGVTSRVFTVSAQGTTVRPRVTVRIDAVVRREGCSEGLPTPCIVSWREG